MVLLFRFFIDTQAKKTEVDNLIPFLNDLVKVALDTNNSPQVKSFALEALQNIMLRVQGDDEAKDEVKARMKEIKSSLPTEEFMSLMEEVGDYRRTLPFRGKEVLQASLYGIAGGVIWGSCRWFLRYRKLWSNRYTFLMFIIVRGYRH
jgi:hypothetical protein